MRRTLFVAAITLLSLSLAPVAFSQSQTNWVSVVSVFDITGNASLQTSQPLLAGHAYNVTMQIAVPFTQTSSEFFPALSNKMLAHGAQFWYVLTPGYAGYNSSAFVPGSRTIGFHQVTGTLVLSAIFQIPANITLVTTGNFTRHLAQSDFSLVVVNVSGGSSVGLVSANIEDQTIQTYLTTYQAKSTLISSGKIDSTYTNIVNSILTESQALYALGLPDQGTTLLNTLDPSAFPAPPSTTMITALTVGVVVAAVVVVLLLVVVIRGRGKKGYSSGIVSEVQKELAILEVTAAKYDRALADRLQALRNKLGETE